ncbi:MAG TPA: excinuclease ABC subunit UvrA [Candidatus Moranbacteria bacterium]|nr:excinuclease ABC subunit UvrA [Candidatus Moranbacteria bacterium]
MEEEIIIRGAREHNLKNINLNLPRNKFIVFTGISGSGKSTLAFDTIFAEGQRRYLESLSSYARQFLGQMDKPDVDLIQGLSPAISIDQKSASHNPRSTVGTVTEIHDYLRLLYSKIGIPHCPICNQEIKKLSVDEIVDRILDLCTGKNVGADLVSAQKGQAQGLSLQNNCKIEILSPVVRSRKGEYSTMMSEMFRRGFSGAYVNGKKIELDSKISEKIKLERYKKHDIDIVVDEVEISDRNISRIFEDVEKALKLSQGLVKIHPVEYFSSKKNNFAEQNLLSRAKNQKKEDLIFNQNLSCPIHEITFPALESRLFSFNSPYGACPACEGLGTKREIDPDLVAPDINKTISQGGLMPWSYKKNNWQGTILRSVANHFHISENIRLRDLSSDDFNLLMHGRPETDDNNKNKGELTYEYDYEDVAVSLRSKSGSVWKYNMEWRGVIGYLEDRYKKTDSEAVRQDIEKYMSQNPCSVCHGSRYKKEALLVTVGNKNIYELSRDSVDLTLKFFKELKINKREEIIAGRILKEIQNRLGFLENVGLGYLTLGRAANTLAGGETQRIRLASQIGSQLVGVLYILDEPSVGLHARDNSKLLETLLRLKNVGNSVIVVEHDEETIRAADHIVDIGLGAGNLGGKIIVEGSPKEVIKNKKSLTAAYLRGDLKIEIPAFRRPIKNKKWITVRGARENNLKNITAEFPLKVFTCVTGVSGSGKSTLVEDVLYKSLASKIMRSLDRPGSHSEIIGMHHINKVIMIDQSPIGRTPRSNPATYTGLFTPIRELFSATRDAKGKGYGPGRFSFNVNGGRCDNCKGDGYLKIEMQFMPDVYLPCDVCHGKRYNSETLQVKYKGKNIAEVLEMTVAEGKIFFENYPEIYAKLKILDEVGLGYIKLGQSATTLSGGEAQRIKLATELARRATGDTLYILDEPTTGLHFDDIKKLLNVLNRLVDSGNSVVVIEHNMDVIKTADWIIDLGPEGGENGGKIVVTGTPEEVVKYHKESWTGKYLRKFLKIKNNVKSE